VDEQGDYNIISADSPDLAPASPFFICELAKFCRFEYALFTRVEHLTFSLSIPHQLSNLAIF
jgi:hypothetical protein